MVLTVNSAALNSGPVVRRKKLARLKAVLEERKEWQTLRQGDGFLRGINRNVSVDLRTPEARLSTRNLSSGAPFC